MQRNIQSFFVPASRQDSQNTGTEVGKLTKITLPQIAPELRARESSIPPPPSTGVEWACLQGYDWIRVTIIKYSGGHHKRWLAPVLKIASEILFLKRETRDFSNS